jgi:hypothetical protein
MFTLLALAALAAPAPDVAREWAPSYREYFDIKLIWVKNGRLLLFHEHMEVAADLPCPDHVEGRLPHGFPLRLGQGEATRIGRDMRVRVTTGLVVPWLEVVK